MKSWQIPWILIGIGILIAYTGWWLLLLPVIILLPMWIWNNCFEWLDTAWSFNKDLKRKTEYGIPPEPRNSILHRLEQVCKRNADEGNYKIATKILKHVKSLTDEEREEIARNSGITI